MPRKSSASLAVVSRVPGRGRPEPAADLDLIEQRIWREVVDALPGHWLDSAGQLVLRRLVAQAAVSERQEARLPQLRATPRSQLRSRAAGSKVEQAPGWRPWEIRGRGQAQTETEQRQDHRR